MNNDIEQLKIKRLVKNLDSMKGNGTSMITLIIPPNSQLSLFRDMLTTEYGTASNIKSRINRLSVLSAITSTQHTLKLYKIMPKNGLVIFCGTAEINGKEKKVNINFEPFKPINSKKYVCDNKFHTEDLHQLFIDDKSFGFIILDGNGCLFGTVAGNNKNILYKFNVELPKKHGRGGQSALRFARLRLEARAAYIKKITELAVKYFITDNIPNIGGIILAGSAGLKNDLANSKFFDNRLKKIIIKIIDISYGGENGFSEAIGQSTDVLVNFKLTEEKKLLSFYFGEISMDTGKICYSYSDTLYALEIGAVDTIIIWENYNKIRYTYYDDKNNKEIIKILDPDKNTNSNNLILKNSQTLLDWLIENYHNFGAKIKVVTDNTNEGSQFVGMSGIGAILRYQVDFSVLEINNDK